MAPAFVFAWFTGALRENGAVVGGLKPVRNTKPIRAFIDKKNVLTAHSTGEG